MSFSPCSLHTDGMADRRWRLPWSKKRQAKEVLNREIDSDHLDEIKALTTAARVAETTRRGRYSASTESEGLQTDIDYRLLKQVARKSEVIDAILRRTVDDVLGNGYEFVLADDLTEGAPDQLKNAVTFFRTPNSDDSGDEWLESVIYDLQLFGDAYIELDGSSDTQVRAGHWTYGGDLQGVWHISADSMRIMPEHPTGKLPDPPKMAYVQVIGDVNRQYTSDKIIHIAKLRQGRAYGTSPLLSLLKIVSGQLNLTEYIGRLFSGMLPKTLVNVGDISTKEMNSMLALIEQQVAGGQSPYGLITVNGGSGFNIHKLIDSPAEGQFLDQLYYYREEIYAVFGIPPMKLGWVQTGKLANPEQQLDAWYDVIDSFHRKLEGVINGRILPMMGVTDWQLKFNPIRPARDSERADILAKQSAAIKSLRQEGAISINEARRMLDLEALTDPEADDPFFVSPVLNINRPSEDMPPSSGSGGGDTSDPEADQDSEDEDEDTQPPELPPLQVDASVDPTLFTDSITKRMGDERWQAKKDRLYDRQVRRMNNGFTGVQSDFAKSAINTLRSLFKEKSYGYPRYNKQLTAQDTLDAMNALDPEVQFALRQHRVVARGLVTSGYEDTLEFVAQDLDIALALNPDDLATIMYFENVWVAPALTRTIGAHRDAVIKIFEEGVENGRNWKWVEGEMQRRIDPTGDLYPRYYYERIARTEAARIVENGHLSAYSKMGFTKYQRLVVIDETTDKDLCAPYEDYIYDAVEARGTLPAHPNCRCSMTPIVPDPAAGEPELLIDTDVN